MRFQYSWGILALLGSFAQGLLNATSLLSLLESTTECAGCETVLLALKPIALLGDQVFVDTITAVCVNAHLEDADVCRGAIGSEGPIIAHDLREMIIPSHTASSLCTSLLGLCPYPEVRPYQVQFPKPKPNTTRPASSGQQESLQIVHFSDIHVDLEYETGSNYNCTKPICCRPYTAADAPGNTSYPAGPHGNHKCDAPESLEESMYSAIQQFAPNASFALFTGDIPDHAIWLVNQPIVTNDIQKAYAKMAVKLGMPVYATAGNHEAAPVNSFPPTGIIGATSSQWVYDTLSTAWTQWIGAPAAAQADTYGAYAYKVPNTNLRIINLNTNFYYSVNFWLYTLRMQYDPNNQLAWLVNQMQYAEDNGERVYIIGHMPFGVSDTLRDGSNYLNQIVNRYEATIAAMFFGHTHLDSFEISYRNGSSPSADGASAISYICPSLTPTSGSPAFRVYAVDPTTYGVRDFTEYTSPLESASFQTPTGPQWSAYYTAKSAYGTSIDTVDPLAEMTPSFWHRVTQVFEADDSAFQAYNARKSRGWNVRPCTGQCKADEICQLRASEAQYNCDKPKPGLQFRKRDGGLAHAHGHGPLESECHGSLTAEVFRGVLGRKAAVQ